MPGVRTGLVAAFAALACLLAPAAALAQNVTASLTNAPNLEGIIAGTASTTFTVADTGTVTASPIGSAYAVRTKSTATTALTLSIVCATAGGSSKDCRGASFSVRILEGAASGAGDIGAFTCAAGQSQPAGLTYTCTAGVSGSSAYVDVNYSYGASAAIPGWTSTIKLGVSMVVPGSAARGPTAVPASCTRTSGGLTQFTSSGCSTAIQGKILRPMAVAKDTDLAFGRIVRPATGSGTVTVETTGARSVSGGAAALASSVSSAAAFRILGEGAQAITVSIPPTFNLAKGGDTLVVTTANDLPGGSAAQTLAGAIGSDATLTVKVGGSITVLPTTPSGTYSGTVTLTATYQ